MPNTNSLQKHQPMPLEVVARKIFFVRGQRVMLDSDLAQRYHVTTGNLNLAIRRNAARFPGDFMFQLTKNEQESLVLQIAIAKTGRGGRQTPPYAFTELGVAMLSSVLKSERAVQMNIAIMRAFVKLREVLATNRALAQRIEQLTATQKDHAALFDIVIQDIQKLDQKFSREIRRLQGPRRRKARIGFLIPGEKQPS
jgi:hypothetical protein